MTYDILVNLTHTAVVVFGALTMLWTISIVARDASLIDIFWGFGFLLVGAICLYLLTSPSDYQWLLAALPIIWGARLTLYLAKRNLGHGEDKRYVAMRARSEKKGMSELAWRLRSLLTIYFGQGLLIMIVSTPIWVAMATSSGFGPENHPSSPNEAYTTSLGLLSIAGAIIWLIGFLFEAVGDAQLASFIKDNKGYAGPIEDKPVMDKGLWKYTRHPNYFGNACMWWGIWLVASQAPWGWVTIFAPLIMTFLLTRVSGRDLLEREMKKRKNYVAYMENTSGFFPMRPNR